MRAAPPTGWYPKRGEVYVVLLDKPRPAIVLSVDALNDAALDVCVVAITTSQRGQFRLRVPIRAGEFGMNRDCWAKCDQVTTLEKRLIKYPAIGSLDADTLEKVEAAVKICLGLD
ncbi:MAG TPA: type II toxin-antitoxin system PemK/MazF family toxin [Candidatus Acidoferrales bacterium]|nr:type II toxin-antitoxin system PemK/MazF family toxin [Candidatus Acidoferrales bacterium]